VSFYSLALVAGLLAFAWWRLVARHQEGRDPTADLRDALGMAAAPPAPPAPFSLPGLLGAAFLLFLSWAAFRWFEMELLRYGLACLLAFSAGRRLSSNLARLNWPRPLARPGPGFAAVLLAVGAAWSINNDIRAARQGQIVVAEEKSAADVIRDERRPWHAGPGVTEAATGPFLVWFTLPSRILVDLEGEKPVEKSGMAERRVPVDVVILNNSFEDAELDVKSCGGRLWRAWVTRAGSGEALAEWSAPWPGEKALFQPARRADFPVDWNGRDGTGTLLPPGEYVAHLEAASHAGEEAPVRAERAFSIVDAGPVSVESPVTSWPRQMLENQRLLDQMRRNIDMMQRMQFDALRPR
jgi:hypothetical protein